MTSASYKPQGWPAVVPRLFADDIAGLVGFLKSVTGAEGDILPGRPVELRIGDSMVMVSDGAGLRELSPAFLYVYVPDTDLAFRRALDAGAEAIEPPADLPYGDRRAMVRDPWGNHWQLATRLGGAG